MRRDGWDKDAIIPPNWGPPQRPGPARTTPYRDMIRGPASHEDMTTTMTDQAWDGEARSIGRAAQE